MVGKMAESGYPELLFAVEEEINSNSRLGCIGKRSKRSKPKPTTQQL